jgi:hypothetical protein
MQTRDVIRPSMREACADPLNVRRELDTAPSGSLTEFKDTAFELSAHARALRFMLYCDSSAVIRYST